MLVMVWPPVALTNSLLMNKPVGSVIFFPLGAVRSTCRFAILYMLETEKCLVESDAKTGDDTLQDCAKEDVEDKKPKRGAVERKSTRFISHAIDKRQAHSDPTPTHGVDGRSRKVFPQANILPSPTVSYSIAGAELRGRKQKKPSGGQLLVGA